MESHIISQLNHDYTKNVGKHYLMYGNLRSTLLRYKMQTIYLDIKVSDNWTRSPKETALQIATSWRSFHEVLDQADSYVVSFSLMASPEPSIIIQGKF